MCLGVQTKMLWRPPPTHFVKIQMEMDLPLSISYIFNIRLFKHNEIITIARMVVVASGPSWVLRRLPDQNALEASTNPFCKATSVSRFPLSI